MNEGMFTIATALDARFNAQEAISKNLANSNALGYRREVPGFYGFGAELYNAQQALTSEPMTAAGIENLPPQRDNSPGLPWDTGRPLDFTIQGEGFFVIKSPSGETRLTRNGHFNLDPEGRLINEIGHFVMGKSGEITIPKGAKMLVKENGSVEADGQEIDKLKIVKVENPLDLFSEGGSIFQVENNKGVVDVETPLVVAGNLELSNVNIPLELAAMIENSRSAEMAGKALSILDEGLGKAIQNFSS